MYPWIKYEACAATSLVSSKTCQTTEWINWDEASEYYLNLVDECGTDMTNSCWMNGNRWSIIYILCAISMLLLAVNAGLMVLGACSHHARGLSVCCGSLCCCLELAAIITTGAVRYSTWGKFSALSLASTQYDASETSGQTLSLPLSS